MLTTRTVLSLIAALLPLTAQVTSKSKPTTGVEVSRIPLVSGFLGELRAQGRTILLVEHNVEVVAGLADQVVVLQGSVITFGPPAQVLRDERVIREYLGRLYDA